MFELIIITLLNGLPMVNTTPHRFDTEAQCRKAGSMLAVHLSTDPRQALTSNGIAELRLPPVLAPRPQVRCVHRR
jgi:hypothetical protein